jgi:hypothetical protein
MVQAKKMRIKINNPKIILAVIFRNFTTEYAVMFTKVIYKNDYLIGFKIHITT